MKPNKFVDEDFLDQLEKLTDETINAIPRHEFMIVPIKKIKLLIAKYRSEIRVIEEWSKKWEPTK